MPIWVKELYSNDQLSSCYLCPVTFILASKQHDHVQVLLNEFILIMDLSYFWPETLTLYFDL